MNLLFDAPLIDGLEYREEVIRQSEERELIDRLMALDLAPFRFHGWLGHRKTMSFGWRYDFDDASFTRTEPIPPWLDRVRAQAAAFARLKPDDFVHVLLARYDPGAGIGWHRDRDVFENVVGISLGTRAVLRFRGRSGAGFKRAGLDLAPRSAYLLSGEARWEWEHRILPGDQLRFSITFRTLSNKAFGSQPHAADGNGPRPERFCRHALGPVVFVSRGLFKRSRSRPALHQPGAFARSRMGSGQ